jgi:hypothetical protein
VNIARQQILPVPLSPDKSTAASVGAILSIN